MELHWRLRYRIAVRQGGPRRTVTQCEEADFCLLRGLCTGLGGVIGEGRPIWLKADTRRDDV
jgi:hypothetical protein